MCLGIIERELWHTLYRKRKFRPVQRVAPEPLFMRSSCRWWKSWLVFYFSHRHSISPYSLSPSQNPSILSFFQSFGEFVSHKRSWALHIESIRGGGDNLAQQDLLLVVSDPLGPRERLKNGIPRYTWLVNPSYSSSQALQKSTAPTGATAIWYFIRKVALAHP